MFVIFLGMEVEEEGRKGREVEVTGDAGDWCREAVAARVRGRLERVRGWRRRKAEENSVTDGVVVGRGG